jgi:hypothetical protein
MQPTGFGGSNMANAFGANIKISIPGQGMYLVVGRDQSPVALVRQSAGKVILQFSDRKLLALLPTTAYLAFRGRPEITFIGPVTIDQERFAHFTASLNPGADQPDPPQT